MISIYSTRLPEPFNILTETPMRQNSENSFREHTTLCVFVHGIRYGIPRLLWRSSMPLEKNPQSNKANLMWILFSCRISNNFSVASYILSSAFSGTNARTSRILSSTHCTLMYRSKCVVPLFWRERVISGQDFRSYLGIRCVSMATASQSLGMWG